MRAFTLAAALWMQAGGSGCAPSPVPDTGARGALSDAAPFPIGRDVRALLPKRWLNAPIEFGGPSAPKATLVRFWTGGCPYCERSLPAIEELRGELGPRGLAVVGVYHPKPPAPVSDALVRESAAEFGFGGALAIDPEWSALRALWLDRGAPVATSASFLLDRNGVVRHVHPGPELHPSTDPEHADCDRAWRELRAAIEQLLSDARK